ncbi:MAG: glycosyltransferase family 2 protein [Candidatus Sericytochromatia bacterium]|nr:glycosyltransferase family 2 protein [Candidatus Sericytochromatia bacterium]
MAPPVVSIVIVNWNTRELLRACLESVAAATRVSHEVWVVDNGSGDGSAALVREGFPGVHLIANADNRGFAAANNQALRLAQGTYVLLLNSDTVVHPGAIDAMVAFLHARPGVGAAGCRLLNADGTLQPSAHAFYSPLGALVENQLVAALWPWRHARTPWLRLFDHSVARPVGWVCGAALMVRRAALREVGLLDEGFFMYGEEVDWQLRLQRAGWPVWFVPHGTITHLGGGSSRQAVTEMRRQERASRARFVAKHHPPASRWLYHAQAHVGVAFWRTLGRLRGRPVTLR